jgi:hypothetical protein
MVEGLLKAERGPSTVLTDGPPPLEIEGRIMGRAAA